MHLTIPISDIMTSKVVTLHPSSLMTEVQSIFDRLAIHHLPITDKDGRAVGMISRKDFCQLQHHLTRFGLSKAHQENTKYFKTLTVADTMSMQPVTLDFDQTLDVALDIFLENKIHAIIVTSDQRCVGILTPYDILKNLKESSPSYDDGRSDIVTSGTL